MKRKLAIIVSGGGMTCSYSAGVLYALAKKYKLTNPDIAITGSGGAGTLSYYTAHQYESIKNIWTNLLATKIFINPIRFWKIIDIDYLIDEVFKNQDLLEIMNLRRSQTELFISTTNYITGELKYFSNRSSIDFFELLRATKAMPVAYNKQVYLDRKRFCDTFKSSSPYVHIQKALEENATDIILIDTTTKKNIITQLGFNAWVKLRSKKFKDNYERIVERRDFETSIFIIKPEKELQVTTLNNGKELLTNAFNQGYREAIDNKELEALIKDFC